MAKFVKKNFKDDVLDYEKYFSPSNVPITKSTDSYKSEVFEESYDYEYPVYGHLPPFNALRLKWGLAVQ